MILSHCRGKQRAVPHPWADMILLLGSTSTFQSILYFYSWLSMWGQKKNRLHTGSVQILFTLTRFKSKGKALRWKEGKPGEQKPLRKWYKAHGCWATRANELGKVGCVENRDCAAFFVLQLVSSTIQDYSWTVHPSFVPTWHSHHVFSRPWRMKQALLLFQTATGFLHPACVTSWLGDRSKDARARGCPTPYAPPPHRSSSSHCISPPSVLFL